METIYEYRDQNNSKNYSQNQTQNLNQLIVESLEVSFQLKLY
jgi:hypothetical protein